MEELNPKFRDFALWLHDPKSPFDTVFQGIDKTKPRITYRKGNADKEWSLDEVWKYYCENVINVKAND
jgi:hypothetical protein